MCIRDSAPVIACADDVRRVEESLQHVIPEDPNVPYDIKDIIEPIVDNHYFFEVKMCIRDSPYR